MLKCTMLLPKTDNDGKSLTKETHSILAILYDLFDGYSIDGETVGICRLRDGSRSRDCSLRVIVVIQAGQLSELKKLAGLWAGKLRQEFLYFESALSNVDFIEPAKDAAGKVRKATPAEGELARGVLSGMPSPLPPEATLTTIGEFSDHFDGRNTERQAAYDAVTARRKQERVEETARREQIRHANAPILERASIIWVEVYKNGSYEMAGDLPRRTIDALKRMGLTVNIYKEYGNTYSTVVRP